MGLTVCIPQVLPFPVGMSSQRTTLTAGAVFANALKLLESRDLASAQTAFAEAERLGADPDECSAGRWETCMLRGDMGGAWVETDAIRTRGRPDPHRFWDGSDVRGKRVMVRSLHGFGDTIQMLRYFPALLAKAKRVIFEVPPSLLSLVTCLPLALDAKFDVITWGEQAPELAPLWDIQIEITELPYLFRTQVGDLPIFNEYLQVPQTEVTRVAERMGSTEQRRVGVVWTAGDWNPERAVDPQLLRSIMTVEAEFWSLVHGTHTREAEEAGIWHRMHDAERNGQGIVPMAATIANLDLVITTDTMAAHLAGAIGRPVWVLLHYAADWRWMWGRTTSPWYPSMRLFRQPSPGDWQTVVAEIEAALRDEVVR